MAHSRDLADGWDLNLAIEERNHHANVEASMVIFGSLEFSHPRRVLLLSHRTNHLTKSTKLPQVLCVATISASCISV